MATNYDRYGRMSYSPELHKNQGKVWTYEEVEYLKIGMQLLDQKK